MTGDTARAGRCARECGHEGPHDAYNMWTDVLMPTPANPAGLDERSRDDILAAYVLSQPPDPTEPGLPLPEETNDLAYSRGWADGHASALAAFGITPTLAAAPAPAGLREAHERLDALFGSHDYDGTFHIDCLVCAALAATEP